MGRVSDDNRGNPSRLNNKKKALIEDEHKVFDRVPRSDGEELEGFAEFLTTMRRLVRGDPDLERELKERENHATVP